MNGSGSRAWFAMVGKGVSEGRSGPHLEHRLLEAIRKLENIGFAKDLRPHEQVADRDGVRREVDLTFTLHTWVVDLRISAECKSRSRSLSLSDINQIRTYKNDLPERNLYWLVVDGAVSAQASRSLKAAGISVYDIAELERIVERIVSDHINQDVEAQRKRVAYWQTMHPAEFREALAWLRQKEFGALSHLSDLLPALEAAPWPDPDELPDFMRPSWMHRSS